MRVLQAEPALSQKILPARLPAVPFLDALIPTGRNEILLEPSRDWSVGPVTGHRLRVMTYMALSVAALYALQSWLWPHGGKPHGLFEEIWSWTSLIWVGPAIPALGGLAGLMMFRHPRHLDAARSMETLVSFRIVSRGINAKVLTSTIRRCQQEMAKTPLFPYVIEVVTDATRFKLPPPNDDIRFITVPRNYKTPNGTLFKARALDYASKHSKLSKDAWLVHLDEETQPTASGIKGICAMIREEEASGTLRIGQGPILYHRGWKQHPFLTLADNIRTGYDFAHFHFQHRVGITIFGLHGSYIVVRNDVEKAVGFDVGPQGSITEDAFWALLAMEKGFRCRCVEGYLEEQSTQSIKDFIRQRRRWFQGLVKVSLFAPVGLMWRIPLGYNTLMTALTPFAMLYTVGHLIYGFTPEPWILLLANASFAAYSVVYLTGLTANLDEYGITNPLKRLAWRIVQIILLPCFSIMEALGVLAAIFRPRPGFYVVKK